MVLLFSIIAAELFVIVGLAMCFDGRRPSPSIVIRNEFLFGIAANVVVALMIFSVGAFLATLVQWWQDGVSIEHGWIIVGSLAATFEILRRMRPRARLAGYALLAASTAAASTAAAAANPDNAAPSVPEAA